MWWNRCSFLNESSPPLSPPSQSKIVRGEKVTPMRRKILTLLVNSEVLRIRKMSEIHVWKWWRSLGCCVSVCGISFRVLFQSAVSFWWMHMQSFESVARSRTETTHTEKCEVVQACTSTWTHSSTVMCSQILMFIIWLVLGKGLSCRSEVVAAGFHG